MPAKYPKPYCKVISVAETTQGTAFNDTMFPVVACKQEVTFLWRDVKRIEGPPKRLDNGEDQPFVRGNTEPITAVVFNDGSALYTPATFKEINDAFLNWLIYSSSLVPGSLGI